jgi:hypothetical protein
MGSLGESAWVSGGEATAVHLLGMLVRYEDGDTVSKGF